MTVDDSGSLILDNQKAITQKDSGGTARNILYTTAGNTVRHGERSTIYVELWTQGTYIAGVTTTGMVIQAAKTLDCATNGAYFKPRRLSQSAQPTPQSGEMLIWRDSDDGKTYIVYNDPTSGGRKVEMT